MLGWGCATHCRAGWKRQHFASRCLPPALPAGPASLAERRGNSPGSNLQQVTDEVTTFFGPTPSNFTGRDDEALGPRAKEFWFSVPFFRLAVMSAAPSSRAVRGCRWRKPCCSSTYSVSDNLSMRVKIMNSNVIWPEVRQLLNACCLRLQL